MPDLNETKATIAYTSWEQAEALRERIRAGEVITQEEYRAALEFIRASRTAATTASPKSKATRISKTAEAEAALDALL